MEAFWAWVGCSRLVFYSIKNEWFGGLSIRREHKVLSFRYYNQLLDGWLGFQSLHLDCASYLPLFDPVLQHCFLMPVNDTQRVRIYRQATVIPALAPPLRSRTVVELQQRLVTWLRPLGGSDSLALEQGWRVDPSCFAAVQKFIPMVGADFLELEVRVTAVHLARFVANLPLHWGLGWIFYDGEIGQPLSLAQLEAIKHQDWPVDADQLRLTNSEFIENGWAVLCLAPLGRMKRGFDEVWDTEEFTCMQVLDDIIMEAQHLLPVFYFRFPDEPTSD